MRTTLTTSELIEYHVNTKLQTEIPADLRHDIRSNIREMVAEKTKEINAVARQLNELRLWLKRERPEGYELVLATMERLANGESVR